MQVDGFAASAEVGADRDGGVAVVGVGVNVELAVVDVVVDLLRLLETSRISLRVHHGIG
ncbi:hypothetical protein [Streptomyces sp. NPDC017202]|uniref:hypothetical protein n=1 Tax=Streptomyces sp. NPDC017202 TaxID=3364981 RepID=UPI0037B3DBDE